MRNNQVMHTILVVLFPFILVGFEAGFRFLVKEPVWDFVGPSLSVAGLSFLVSATKFEKTRIGIAGNRGLNATIDNNQYVTGVYLAILLGILLWGVSLYYSAEDVSTKIWLMPAHAFVGAIIYVASVIIFHLKGNS